MTHLSVIFSHLFQSFQYIVKICKHALRGLTIVPLKQKVGEGSSSPAEVPHFVYHLTIYISRAPINRLCEVASNSISVLNTLYLFRKGTVIINIDYTV